MTEPRKNQSGVIHPSAFEIVEISIYGYAIYSLVKSIWHQYKITTSSAEAGIIYFVIGSMFVFIILQNYILMRIADDKVIGFKRGYRFLDQNKGIHRFVERSLRLIIIYFVILTAKYPVEANPYNALPFVPSTFSHILVEFVKSLFIIKSRLFSYFDGNLPNTNLFGKNEYSSLMEYYSGAIFTIVLLNFLWDIVNISAVQKRKLSVGTDYLKYKKRSPYGSYLFSLLSYLYIAKPLYKNGHDTIEFTDYITKDSRDPGLYVESMVKSGKLRRIYLFNSPVARCRFAGLLFSLLIASGSIFESFSAPFLLLTGACLVIYGFYLTKIDRVLDQLLSPFKMIYRYLFSREGV